MSQISGHKNCLENGTAQNDLCDRKLFENFDLIQIKFIFIKTYHKGRKWAS